MHLKTPELIHELKHHLPFTAIASFLGIVLAIILISFSFQMSKLATSFEFLHFAHILVSAIVSTAIFYKYRKSKILSILVGVGLSIIIGSLSDIIFPYLGGTIFNFNLSFHLPLIEEPLAVILSALVGSLAGLMFNITKFPHFLHVLISTFASLLYLLSYTPVLTTSFLIISFFITLIAVIIPCCLSDIVFPFLFLGERIKHCNCDDKDHSH